MTVLLIGGSGPTGPHIIDGLLDRGQDVTVLNRGSRALHRGDGIEHLKADPHFAEGLTEALRGRTFDAVIATYGRLRMMPPILARSSDRVITVGGTAYAENGGRPANEDAPRDTSNTIIRRIVETETALAEAHRNGLFNHTHLRYPLLWGPGQIGPKEWSVVRRVLDGRPFIPMVDGGRTIETKCYVTNAAQAVLLALDEPQASSGQTYNVTDDESPDDETRVRDLVRALDAPEMGLLHLPRAATGPAAFWAIGRDLDYRRQDRQPRTSHLVVDGTRIRVELGFTPRTSYAAAVIETANHYRDHPLAPSGEEEQKVGDPFDYAAEDAYAALLDRYLTAAHDIPFAATEYVHQYDHPKQT